MAQPMSPNNAPEYPPLVLKTPANIAVITDLNQLPELTAWLDEHPEFGWDIETTPLRDFYWRRARTMQFGNLEQQFIIDLLGIVGGDTDALRDSQGSYGKHLDPRLRKLIETLRPYLCERKFLKIGVNLGFEYLSHYWLFGLRTQNFFDCMLVEKCIWAGAIPLMRYDMFSMGSMLERYFHRSIDKVLQRSFNLSDPLTNDQICYACDDVRYPFMLKHAQDLIIAGTKRQVIPSWINAPNRICGDNLTEIVQLENDAIGAFQDMTVHGDCIDIPRWTAKIERRKLDLITSLAELDAAFIPFVGRKGGLAYTEVQVADAETKWKSIKLPKAIGKEIDDEGKSVAVYTESDRLVVEEREAWKANHSDMKKANTARRKRSEDCEGVAFINYNSPTQIKDVLHQVPGLEKLKSTDADTLEKYEYVPICKALSTYRKIAKEISTYGMTWCEEWVTDCPQKANAAKGRVGNKETGWINPHDHRLHPQYNQYDAATGRSSSDSPNGQNLPHDKETRACFIAGPPDEDIIGLKNSKCCGKRAESVGVDFYVCTKCKKMVGIDQVEDESYVLLTIDMAGAELRIIAEQSNERIWIDAFNKGQDVHSICCELVDAAKWQAMTAKCGDMMEKKGVMVPVPPCAFYALGVDGKPQKFKCECPKHNEYRNDFKPVNFGIAYGLGPGALSVQIKKPVEFCKEVLKSHRNALPVLWSYIDLSGQRAIDNLKARDLFGRRELFDEPSYNDAVQYVENHKDDDNPPNIKTALRALYGMIERAGKNMPIQSANASIAKLALGSGCDRHGKEYLWHIFPRYWAKLIKFVHDEFVVRCLKSNSDEVALLTADAIRRAAATKLRKVTMESEFHIEVFWCK
jgi:DNA polymerase I-like protein with 3'-5' exonuclease and polymerase domains